MHERVPHTRIEDIAALLTGTWIISFGIVLLKQCGTLTGGTAGMAFVANYALHVNYGTAFFVLNLPFYYLAFKRMGWDFVIKTFCSIALVSVFTSVHPLYLHITGLNPLYGTLAGTAMMGLGFIVLFRHKASLGGVNIVALYLQDRYGWRAGKVQMGVDVSILLLSSIWVSPDRLAISVLGAVMLNLMIAMNHRPNRYLA